MRQDEERREKEEKEITLFFIKQGDGADLLLNRAVPQFYCQVKI